MEDLKFNTNLPHIYNSCGINALFITLAHFNASSSDELVNKMIEYCKVKRRVNEPRSASEPLNINDGIELMKQFYEKFNIDHGYQNVRLLLKKIYDQLTFENAQIEIGDDYEKIDLNQKLVLLDLEQTKSMVEYNKEKEDKTNRLLTYKNENFNNISILTFNDKMYIPCLYIVCLGGHYITLVNTKCGLIIYNDLDQVRVIEQQKSRDVLLRLGNSVEFIGYLRAN